MITAERLEKYADASGLKEFLGVPRGGLLNFRPLGRGEYNDNWSFEDPAGRRLVLRVNMGSQMRLPRQIAYEFNALELLAGSGRTPKPLWFDDSRSALPFGALVMEWLPGRPLDYRTDLSRAAEILADVHSVSLEGPCGLIAPLDPLGAMFEECEAMLGVCLDSPLPPESLKRRLRRLSARARKILGKTRPAPGRRCVVNTELNSGNFLINEGGASFLVDWEKPIYALAVQDLAHFLAPTTTFWKTDVVFSRREMEPFLEEYSRRRGRGGFGGDFEDYLVMTCLRGTTWCAMAQVQYRDGSKPLRNDFTRRKIDDYLSDPFLERIESEFFGL